MKRERRQNGPRLSDIERAVDNCKGNDMCMPDLHDFKLDGGPKLYGCETCGTVFFREPRWCPHCKCQTQTVAIRVDKEVAK